MRLIWGGVLAALLMAAAVIGVSCKSSKNPVSSGGGAADVTITIVGELGSSSFSPNPDTVTVGKTVAWHNSAGITHTSTQNSNAWDTGGISPGGTSSPVAMNTAGSFPYHCSIHPTMTGTLVVRP
jgi:plastocyanin